jgi:hypothetical protein
MEGLRIITITNYRGQHNATASIRQKWLHTSARVKERIGLATAVANAQAPHHVATIASQDCIGTYQSLSSERWSTKITVQC